MISVGIHPPKTPVTEGSMGIAKATTPNVCKMPGPPAPFVPSPLPNIAKSGSSPKGYSRTVKIEGDAVAIRGATFGSIGDIASKGTGGGLISANTHGPAKFITPGSLTVKIQGKSVHLLGEPMLNNCGPSGAPPNTGATLQGVKQLDQGGDSPIKIDCDKGKPSKPTLSKCDKEELCEKGKSFNRQVRAGKLQQRITGKAKHLLDIERKSHLGTLNRNAQRGEPLKLRGFWAKSPECIQEAIDNNYQGYSPDHIKDIGLGGHVTSAKNLKWMSSEMNSWFGSFTGHFDPAVHTGVDVSTCCA